MLKLLALLFGCRHENTTRAFTFRDQWPRRSYVVCLDCGARLAYNLETMRAGRALEERIQQPDLVAMARRREA
jgi:hypothetical protein